jgi:hypothetical protein
MNKKIISLLVIATTLSLSAYYDRDGRWHTGVVEDAVQATKDLGSDALDAVTGGRYSDSPQERDERIKAERKLEDKKRGASRKYQDTKEKIQRKKEDRKYR